MFGRCMSRAFSATLVLFVFAFLALGQDLDNVSFWGQVTDANNLPVVGATLTAIRVETGEERVVVTDDEGRYLLINLRPGSYKIKAAATGFGIQTTNDII